MDVVEKTYAGVVVLKVSGRVDQNTSETFGPRLVHAIEQAGEIAIAYVLLAGDNGYVVRALGGMDREPIEKCLGTPVARLSKPARARIRVAPEIGLAHDPDPHAAAYGAAAVKANARLTQGPCGSPPA
ncbi:MAG: hypothetical protein EXQ91_00880 [Alphaproteobacteria bacterium]|nr:hypothetical protein [Alphaproteobacteria bacterium]